ncbi:MAG: hypothetical protein RTU92_01495, partial [Candidatus Thorarchaeota archaeon]
MKMKMYVFLLISILIFTYHPRSANASITYVKNLDRFDIGLEFHFEDNTSLECWDNYTIRDVVGPIRVNSLAVWDFDCGDGSYSWLKINGVNVTRHWGFYPYETRTHILTEQENGSVITI